MKTEAGKSLDVFTALADPTRRRMLELLASKSRPAGAFAEEFPNVSQPTLSHHLKVLRDAGLVEASSEAQRRIYSLRRDALDQVVDWLARTRLHWHEELDALEAHLEAAVDKAKQP
jgi:DNA-binding transcriptional ArsR family regulator